MENSRVIRARAYKYRFYPTGDQKAQLAKTFGCARYVYNFSAGFTNFCEKRAKYPTFKSKDSRQSVRYTKNAFTLKGATLTLAKQIEPLNIVQSLPAVESEVGIDVGIKTLATLSNGQKLENPKPLIRS